MWSVRHFVICYEYFGIESEREKMRLKEWERIIHIQSVDITKDRQYADTSIEKIETFVENK